MSFYQRCREAWTGIWSLPAGEATVELTAPATTDGALGRAWLRDGIVDLASIAAFSRLSMQLMRHGAPPHLIEGCHRAALDEVRHAQHCFALARRHGTGTIEAGVFPALDGTRVPRISKADLAVDSFVEGGLWESFAATLHAAGARAAEEPELAALLAQISTAERAHVELAWDIVAWSLSSDTDSVAPKLRAAAAKLPLEPDIDMRHAPDSWLRHGRPGASAQRELFTKVRETARRRVEQILRSQGVPAERSA
ncbi:hypothetical protein [Tahibacter amnicola]|uniref:Uncharacterized protein n=1 Tax=Tahibacter amnicola TaxID=2976241 RepID=A0ABY6BCH3_9GAMM|nr:hypothetical protein [Tahibacter amnicola]UXI67743.1 hypothetical protein N4264_23905 [Tahibacter amnicola]